MPDTLCDTPTQETIVSNAHTVHAKAVELGKHVVRMTTTAGSGHPSTALALCHITIELMYRHMRYDPANPWNPNSDRLVLSAGHAVPIIYAAYADLNGTVQDRHGKRRLLKLDDLNTLRELNSVLDGHPNPAEGFPFFDAATGSLGQGLSVGAGLALAARLDGIDKRIFVIVGDGESREGQIWEAFDFIVDHKLTNVRVIFSCNGHGQAAAVSPRQSADTIAAKAAVYGWNVIRADGHDPDSLSAALDRADESAKPVAIVAETIKGWGVDSMLGKNFHGKPMPQADLKQALAELDATGKKLSAAAGATMAPPAPKAAGETGKAKPIVLPPFEQAVERVEMGSALEKGQLATRAGYGVALVALGDVDKRIVALDGDVSNSTYSDRFARTHPDRFFECKIAEQNMISVGAGLSAGGKIPFASSFAKFLARAADQIDMAGISRANLKIVGSHAGISLGADGPSQMAVSDVAYFRSMAKVDNGRGEPMCRVFQPSDAVAAYRLAELMANVEGMCYMRTHRPNTPFLYPFDEPFELNGCKQLKTGDHLTLASSGYMLHTALEAADRLASRGITCNVFDAYTFPMDPTPILSTARRSGRVILTVEDNFTGGLHSELAEAAVQTGDLRVYGMTAAAIPKSAKTADEVFSHVGVGLEHVIKKATSLART